MQIPDENIRAGTIRNPPPMPKYPLSSPSRESVPPPGVHAHGPATRVTDAAVVPLGVERMTTTVYVEPDAIPLLIT
jgi:hypothetical protein